MPHKKKKKGFEAAQEILNKPKEPERIFQAGVEVPREKFQPQKRIIAEQGKPQREVSPEEFKAFKEEQKIIAEGGRKAITPEEFQAAQTEELPQAREIPIRAFKEGEIRGVPEGKEPTSLQQAAAASGIVSRIRKGGTITPEEQLRFNFTDLDIAIIKSGEADINIIGVILEAVPITRTRIFGIDLSAGTAPGEKVDELVELIENNGDDLREALENAEINPIKRRFWLQEAEKHKNIILRLESRIKIISIQSPKVQGNPDKVFKILGQIEAVKQANTEVNWFS